MNLVAEKRQFLSTCVVVCVCLFVQVLFENGLFFLQLGGTVLVQVLKY